MESSAAPSRGPASFLTQANALLRKNLCFQKRNLKTNIGITIFPVLLCVILVVLQGVIDSELDKPKYRCGCACVDPGPTAVGAACRRTECGIQYSTLDQVGSCPIPSPTPWPALVQLPQPESRAVMTAGQPFDGLPDPTCRDTGTCPGTVLFTGNNRSLAESILFYGVPFNVMGYRQQAGGTGGGKTNEFVAGYDFLNTNRNGLEINIWYNSTYNNNTGFGSIALLRVPRLVNTASNAYIKFLRGTGVEMLLEYVKEMPKVGTQPKFDLSSLLGPLFFTWIVQLLFPVSVILSYLVYEKQQKLKIMMKMHGLKDGPYWLITYAYFVALSAIYMILLLIFGSLIGLNFFRTNAYSIQIVFYFIYINLQIALAFFVASFFSTVKLATDNHYAAVVGYIYVFGSGLLGNFLLGFFIEDTHFPTTYSFLQMIGLVPPTSGTAYIHGMDIKTDMNSIYSNMGVCPQHDLLWETLTGREHLLFYGRLKNLKGDELLKAVDDSLKSVNLFHSGVGDKQVGKYSGGMKRRLSVAISLIGDPKVVFMDEPSTGLDPASRNNLWSVVKEAKKNRAIILTTHSMEEAEVLCDRLGIFVDGGFQCIGNPKELKARYGGTYVLTMTTSSENEQEVEQLVHRLSPNASRIYHISGTQKFELPKQELRIADVFHAVESAKSRFSIYAWGLVDTTLEDVFIKVAKGAQAFSVVA
nr:unnamed protein product [Digitaria exilis]